MANCTYTFTGADGKSTSIKGIPALKAFLLEGGLDTYLPERAMEMQGPSASARPTSDEIGRMQAKAYGELRKDKGYLDLGKR